jgi:archaellum biogenesis ATPase FlaH
MDENVKRRLEHRLTGDAHLDSLLRGGLPHSMLTLVCGPSGSGKSVLGHQLSRLAGGAALYVLTTGLGPEQVDALFADPTPTYLDLASTLSGDGLTAALERLDRGIEGGAVELVVIDSLDALLASATSSADRRRAVRRLADIAWNRKVTFVALARACDEEAMASEALDLATLVITLAHSDSRGPRRLAVVKYSGSEFLAGEHGVRVSAQGLAFDSTAPSAGPPTLVSGLAARILNAFRTARSATPSELASLLGHDLDAVEGALDHLSDAGYLSLQRDEENNAEAVYALVQAA